MTARFYGWNRGDIEVTIGTSTTSKNVEVTVVDGVAGETKRDITGEALVKIRNAILQDFGSPYP